MSMHSSGRLAAAVSAAGGLGTFGGINQAGPDWVREQIRYVRSQTENPFGVGFISQFLPFFSQCFEVALEEKAPIIALSFGSPQPWLVKAREIGAIVICQVQTLEGAREAIGLGADILVAQGNEAGGHTGALSLLPFLVKLVREFPKVPIIAAGGIADSQTLAATLVAGADGACLGTAFLATPENTDIPESHKQLIINSNGEDTVFTEVFDIVESHIMGAPGWPEGIGSRAYNNKFAQIWHGREQQLRQNLKQVAPSYAEAMQKRDPDFIPTLFGLSAAHIDAVRPAAEVLKTLCEGAERILQHRIAQLTLPR